MRSTSAKVKMQLHDEAFVLLAPSRQTAIRRNVAYTRAVGLLAVCRLYHPKRLCCASQFRLVSNSPPGKVYWLFPAQHAGIHFKRCMSQPSKHHDASTVRPQGEQTLPAGRGLRSACLNLAWPPKHEPAQSTHGFKPPPATPLQHSGLLRGADTAC